MCRVHQGRAVFNGRVRMWTMLPEQWEIINIFNVVSQSMFVIGRIELAQLTGTYSASFVPLKRAQERLVAQCAGSRRLFRTGG